MTEIVDTAHTYTPPREAPPTEISAAESMDTTHTHTSNTEHDNVITEQGQDVDMAQAIQYTDITRDDTISVKIKKGNKYPKEQETIDVATIINPLVVQDEDDLREFYTRLFASIMDTDKQQARMNESPEMYQSVAIKNNVNDDSQVKTMKLKTVFDRDIAPTNPNTRKHINR